MIKTTLCMPYWFLGRWIHWWVDSLTKGWECRNSFHVKTSACWIERRPNLSLFSTCLPGDVSNAFLIDNEWCSQLWVHAYCMGRGQWSNTQHMYGDGAPEGDSGVGYTNIAWHGNGFTLLALCLMAPSHYLNQCWLIFSKVLWHSSEGNFAGNAPDINYWYDFENDLFKITAAFLRGQWVNMMIGWMGLERWILL